MPRCKAGILCKNPELGLHSGHGGIKKCPDCREKIHDPCAIIDEAAGLSEMNVCPECFEARKPPAEDDVISVAAISVAAKPLKNKIGGAQP